MKVVEIVPHGYCNGVGTAIAKALELRNAYFLHELVHNEIVLDELRALGHRFVASLDEVPGGATVVFPAHGVSPQMRSLAAERGLKAVDLTCPYVARAHEFARMAAGRGDEVVVLGDRDHAEVKGLLGELEGHSPAGGGSQTSVVCQTTLDGRTVEAEVAKLREAGRRVREVCGPCGATAARQQAVRDFCVGNPNCAVLVLGSSTSANAKRLCEMAEHAGAHAFLAGTLEDVRALKKTLEAFDVVGLTSGASTPERLYHAAKNVLVNVPTHVAIIMDGNGRWARKRGLERGAGHVAGAKTLTRVVEMCGARHIRYLSVYAFSTENWKRSRKEVSGLMRLFAAMMRSQASALVRNRVRFRVIGRRDDLSTALRKAVAALEEKTKAFERELIVCFSYGGRAEVVDAVNRAVERGERVTEETFRKFLYAPDVPDPDLVIRTSGECRVSNFLLWESAYAEYHFTDTLWPDFSELDLDRALADYAGRHRRKGAAE